MAQEEWSIRALFFSRQEGKHFQHWNQHISAACAECQGLEGTNGSYWAWLSPHPVHSPGPYFSTSGAVSPCPSNVTTGLVSNSPQSCPVHSWTPSKPSLSPLPSLGCVSSLAAFNVTHVLTSQLDLPDTLTVPGAKGYQDHLLPSSLLGTVEHQEANGSDLAGNILFTGFPQ